MAYFSITYSDGHVAEFENVSSFSYVSYEKKTVTIDSELEKYPIPIGKPLWLHTDSGTITVSGDGMRLIEVTKE